MERAKKCTVLTFLPTGNIQLLHIFIPGKMAGIKIWSFLSVGRKQV